MATSLRNIQIVALVTMFSWASGYILYHTGKGLTEFPTYIDPAVTYFGVDSNRITVFIPVDTINVMELFSQYRRYRN